MHKRERRESFFLCIREEIFGKRVDKRVAFFGKLTYLPLFLFILFFAFALSSCGKKSTGKIQGREIRLGIDRDNAPFSYLDEEKNPAGFDVELIEAIAKREGFTVKFVPMNPSALQSSVVTGTIVGAMGGIEIREEKQLSFSEAYGIGKAVFGIGANAFFTGEEHPGKGGQRHCDFSGKHPAKGRIFSAGGAGKSGSYSGMVGRKGGFYCGGSSGFGGYEGRNFKN